MSESVRLELAEVAAAAARLARTSEPSALVSSLLDFVRTWAAPSAAFAAIRDASQEGGWRLLPGIVLGSVPVGVERSLARLAEDAPEAFERGGIVQRGDEIAGVRARDNWAVPFWTGEQSGALFLRGVPRPAPEGLAEALGVVAAGVWPRLVGSPADRVLALVSEVRAAAESLAREARRQLEALEAHRPARPEGTPEAGEATEAGRPTSGAGAVDEGRLTALEAELRGLESELERLTTEARDARSEAEMLRGERDALRDRLEKAEARAAESATLSERLAAAEAAAAEAASLRDRLADAEARAAESATLAEKLAAAEAAAAETAALRDRLADAEARAAEGATLAERLAAAEAADAEAAADAAATETASLRAMFADVEARAAQSATLSQRLATVEASAVETSAINEKLDSLRRAAETAELRARKTEEELAAAQRDLALARARSGQQDEERRMRLEEAEARLRALTDQWAAARRALRTAAASVRRAAFLPPAVRVSVQEAVGAEEGESRVPWTGAALLDRDALSLEATASALESAGVAARIASHPEELALLLRTAEASGLSAVVCDVMAFRPDQNVAGLIRGWDKDRPGISYYLSFDADVPAEVERARRIPTSIIAGHLPRPLAPGRLLEALENLARRRGSL